jgi:hypothetical protein
VKSPLYPPISFLLSLSRSTIKFRYLFFFIRTASPTSHRVNPLPATVEGILSQPRILSERWLLDTDCYSPSEFRSEPAAFCPCSYRSGRLTGSLESWTACPTSNFQRWSPGRLWPTYTATFHSGSALRSRRTILSTSGPSDASTDTLLDRNCRYLDQEPSGGTLLRVEFRSLLGNIPCWCSYSRSNANFPPRGIQLSGRRGSRDKTTCTSDRGRPT